MRKLFRNFADGWIAGLLVLGLTACSQEITDLATTISVTATSVAVTVVPPTVQSNSNVATSTRQAANPTTTTISAAATATILTPTDLTKDGPVTPPVPTQPLPPTVTAIPNSTKAPIATTTVLLPLINTPQPKPTASPTPKLAAINSKLEDTFNTMALSPHGVLVALGESTSSSNGVVKLIETATGKEVATLRGHTVSISVLAFSPDGTRLASGSSDKTVRLWNVQTYQLLYTFKGYSDDMLKLFFSPDSKYLASDDHYTVKIWDVQTHTELSQFKGQAGTPMAFSADGKQLVEMGLDAIRLMDVATGKTLVKGDGYADDAVFSQDGKTIILYMGVSDNYGAGFVERWDTKTNKTTTIASHSQAIPGTLPFSGFLPGGNYWAGPGNHYDVSLYSTKNGQKIVTMENPTQHEPVDSKEYSTGVLGVAASSQRELMAVLDRNNTLEVWILPQGVLLSTVKIS